jgi:hypothetical protein
MNNSSKTISLAKLYFLSFKPLPVDGKQFLKLEWHGFVKGCVQPGFYLVQLFDVFDANPATARLVRIEDMTSWHFYPTAGRMKSVYDRLPLLPPPHQSCKGRPL